MDIKHIRDAHTPSRATRAALTLGVTAALVLPMAASAVAVGATAAAPANTATSAAARVNTRDAYVAIVKQGNRRHLRVVSRSTGKVLRHVATATKTDEFIEPFADADLAADGSVWAVVADTKLPEYYQSRLVRYVGSRAERSLPYVTSVRLSPDEKRMAITVLSPDGDGDGYGLSALRLANLRGKVTSTLATTKLPVDRKQGYPLIETGSLTVRGWMGANDLVVTTGCCDEGSVSIVSTLKPTRQQTWPTFTGTGDTTALGVKGSNLLVATSRVVEVKGSPHTFTRAGIDAFWMTKRKPAGTLFTHIRGSNLAVADHTDSLVKKAGATPLEISTKRFPYKGTGSVLRALL